MRISLRPVRRDLIAILCVAALSALLFFLTAPDSAGSAARITVDGQTEAELPLNGPVRSVTVRGVTIAVGGGSARVVSSGCPDQICVHRGALTMAGESAVCLPNRVVVVIVGEDGVDAVA